MSLVNRHKMQTTDSIYMHYIKLSGVANACADQ